MKPSLALAIASRDIERGHPPPIGVGIRAFADDDDLLAHTAVVDPPPDHALGLAVTVIVGGIERGDAMCQGRIRRAKSAARSRVPTMSVPITIREVDLAIPGTEPYCMVLSS